MYAKLISIIFLSFALTGFVYNLWCICEIFFKYQINTEVKIEIPRFYEPLDLTFCARFVDLIPQYVKKEKMNEFNVVNETIQVRQIQHLLNLDEIFHYSPNVSSLFERVQLRRQGSYELVNCESTECLNFYDVKKFVFMEYICYQISLRTDKVSQSFDLIYLAVSPAFSGLSTRINLNPIFNNIFVFKVALSKPSDYPYTELAVAPQRFGDHNLMIGYKSLKAELLTAPYASNCLIYTKIGFKSRDDCYSKCVFERTIDRTNKLPFAVILDDPNYTEKIVSYVDIQNETISNIIHEIHRVCIKRCQYQDCYKESLTTFVSPLSSIDPNFELAIVIPVDPAVHVRTSPKMSIIEFFIFALSTISTWTSLSIMSLNPAELFERQFIRKLVTKFTHVFSGKYSSSTTTSSAHSNRSKKMDKNGRKNCDQDWKYARSSRIPVIHYEPPFKSNY